MMRNLTKAGIIAGLIILALLAGWWYGTKSALFEKNSSTSSTVMLESVKKVTKLIAVEASFSELFDYKESYTMDIFNWFSKKALLRVTAKASIGYDFEKLNISFDSIRRTVTLNEWPQPELLSLEHDLDYYDISQGTFNKFTAEEYNMINKKAKELILQKARNDSVFRQAEEQREDFIFLLELALKNIGWKLIVLPGKTLQG